jgi:hypothetical protein
VSRARTTALEPSRAFRESGRPEVHPLGRPGEQDEVRGAAAELLLEQLRRPHRLGVRVVEPAAGQLCGHAAPERAGHGEEQGGHD